MLILVFIIGLVFILWPVIGGFITFLFNGIILVISLPFYWGMKIIMRPQDKTEDDKLSKISTIIGFIVSICLIFTLIITKA